MFRQSSKRMPGRECFRVTLFHFMFTVALLVTPCTSAHGQVVVAHSPDCNIGLNDQPVICTGWVRCETPYTRLTITATQRNYQVCSGYIVHNNAHVYPLANLTGIGADGQSQLGSGAGKTLKYRYTQVSCTRVKTERKGTVNECPPAPGPVSTSPTPEITANITFTDGETASGGGGGCTMPGWDGSCPPGTTPDSFGMCCPAGDPNVDSCASLGFFWDFAGDFCSTASGGGCVFPEVFEDVSCVCPPPPNFMCANEIPEWGNCPYTVGGAGCSSSPVLVDTRGDGFALTDAARGVDFDIDGNPGAVKERLS